MPDLLTRAIRNRNTWQAMAIVDQMRKTMNRSMIQSRILAAIERLAWEEGDAAAANWLLRNLPLKEP